VAKDGQTRRNTVKRVTVDECGGRDSVFSEGRERRERASVGQRAQAVACASQQSRLLGRESWEIAPWVGTGGSTHPAAIRRGSRGYRPQSALFLATGGGRPCTSRAALIPTNWPSCPLYSV